jgi:hypothetical protein
MNRNNRNSELVYLVMLLAGGVILEGSWLIPTEAFLPGLQQILSGVGTAFLSGAFIGFLNIRYLNKETPDLRKQWGLINIYNPRVDVDKELNDRIITAKEVDAIVQGGLDGLRKNPGVKLKYRLERGLKMQILVPKDPPDPRIKNAIKELEDWYHSLNSKQREKVTIRKYNAVPQELYYRVDDVLVVGPYLADTDGPRNITYMFDRNSTGGEIYTNHFNVLWENSEKGGIV